MQTKVRVVETGFDNRGYNQFYIEVLDNEYDFPPRGFNVSLTIIGRIKFQQHKENGIESDFYGITFLCETSKPEHLLKMAKLAKYIRENAGCDAQPKEILLLIGAKEYFSFRYTFIPVSYVGMQCYKVMTGTNYSEHYTTLFAPNEIKANKMLAEWMQKNKENAKVELDCIVTK